MLARLETERIREEYPVGSTVILEEMAGNVHMPKGLKGIITSVDAVGHIHVSWENGSKLLLIVGEDSFTVEEGVGKSSAYMPSFFHCQICAFRDDISLLNCFFCIFTIYFLQNIYS